MNAGFHWKLVVEGKSLKGRRPLVGAGGPRLLLLGNLLAGSLAGLLSDWMAFLLLHHVPLVQEILLEAALFLPSPSAPSSPLWRENPTDFYHQSKKKLAAVLQTRVTVVLGDI